MSEASIRIASPAPLVDVMALAPRARRLYRASILQHRKSDSVSISIDGRPIVVAMLFPETPETRELCLFFDPAAGAAMRRLVRVAQLMLGPVADSGVVVLARIDLRNRAGRRMARLAGFLETDAEGGRLWIWRGVDERHSESDLRR